MDTKFYKNKKIIITGSNGFVGSGLLNILKKQDCEIYCFSRTKTTKDKDSKAKISMSTKNISEINTWLKILKNVDIVFHLAAHEAKHDEKFDHKKELTTNGEITLAMLEACRIGKFRPKIIFASTSNIVGITRNKIVNEQTSDMPMTLFAIHKKLSEEYFRYYKDNFGIDSTCLRLANVYGPPTQKSLINRSALNMMIKYALDNSELKLFKNKNAIRDFLYIDDVINAFITAAKIKKDNNNYYVLGTETGNSFGEIAKFINDEIKKITGKKIKISSDTKRDIMLVEMRNFIADSSLFRKKTGWRASVELREGINRTINYILQ